MLSRLTCKKCGYECSFSEKDGIFTCQTCGTQYLTDYIAAEIRQKLARETVELILPALEHNTVDGDSSHIQSALNAFAKSDFKSAEHSCDALIEFDKKNYFAWLLKGEAIYLQLALPFFDHSDLTAECLATDVHSASLTSSVEILDTSVLSLQSALFNMQFDKGSDCLIKAINAAPAEIIDDIARIALSMAYNEVLSGCLQMLTSIVDIPITENCLVYSSEKAHLATKALLVSDSFCGKRPKNESKPSLTWETCARWLSRDEFNAATKIWETEVTHYKAGYDEHPSNEAVTRLSNALCTATLIVDLFLLSDPLEDLDIHELNFSMNACDKAIAMCQEAKEFKCYQSAYENNEQPSHMSLELFDERVSKLKIAKERITATIKEQSGC